MPYHAARALDAPSGRVRIATRARPEAVYLYCLVDTERPLGFRTPPVGEPRGAIETLPFRGMAVVMSACRTESCSLSRANALNHQRIMEEALSAGLTVLPIRYGTVAERQTGVVDMVRDRLLVRRRSELLALFGRFAGKKEMSLKVVTKDLQAAIRSVAGEIVGPRTANLSYNDRIRLGMRVQEELHRLRSQQAARILGQVLAPAAEHLAHPPLGDRMVLNAAFLVDDDRLDEWRAAVEAASAGSPDLGFQALGPMPPSSFVNLTISWEG